MAHQEDHVAVAVDTGVPAHDTHSDTTEHDALSGETATPWWMPVLGLSVFLVGGIVWMTAPASAAPKLMSFPAEPEKAPIAAAMAVPAAPAPAAGHAATPGAPPKKGG